MRASNDILLAHGHMNEMSNNVQQCHVAFPDSMNVEAWNDEAVVCRIHNPAAVFASEGDGEHLFFTRRFQRANQGNSFAAK